MMESGYYWIRPKVSMQDAIDGGWLIGRYVRYIKVFQIPGTAQWLKLDEVEVHPTKLQPPPLTKREKP